MRLNNFLNEAFQDKVFIHSDTLWYSYSPGSGTTAIIKNRKYLTDKTGDKNFNDIVRHLVKYSNGNKPLKSKGNSKIFEIPFYNNAIFNYSKFDIWGGDIKPSKKVYMIVNTGSINVINFFDSKNEALAWINTTI
jgi:hypothetical protein